VGWLLVCHTRTTLRLARLPDRSALSERVPMEHSLFAILVLGFALGLQHTLDADHLLAMSALVGRGGSLSRAALAGALWGLGHAAALLVAAVAVIAFRLSIPPAVADRLEGAAGLMLAVLGADLMVGILRGRAHGHSQAHALAGAAHLHVPNQPVAIEGPHDEPPLGRPFVVGAVHGLTGSAAIMLVALGTIPSAWAAFIYVLVFGAGTIAGMLILSSMMSMPFAAGPHVLKTVGLWDEIQALRNH
jgi:high-affinity nickel-transport protein